MTDQNHTEADDDVQIDGQYQPIYEYDPDAGDGIGTPGRVVCNVPREPQIDALRAIAGDGPIEPDGWVEGYNGGMLPVLDGVPITVLEHSTRIGGRSEGAEGWTRYAVDDTLGPVEIHRAFAHPENVSKINVLPRKGEVSE